MLQKKIKKRWAQFIIWLAIFLPTRDLETLTLRLISTKVDRLNPREAAEFLFRLDAAQYPLQSQAAIRYNNGVHPKHRLTRYHEFFVSRAVAGERILDIGCGMGDVDYDLVTKTEAIVDGVDIGPENISKAIARYKHPNLTFSVGDALSMKFEGKYDTVILSNVLEHIRDRSNFLKDIVKTVKPMRLLVRVPVFERDWRVAVKNELGVESRLDEDHKIEYTLESFAKEIEASGLSIHHLESRWGEIWAELHA